MTRQRLAIEKCLSKHPGHYTASEIYALAKEEYPSLSRATVYNTLPALVTEGKLKKLVIDGEPAVYDTTTFNHAHLVCPICGELSDVLLPAVSLVIEDNFGKDTPFTLSIRRICENCKKNNNI